MSSDHLHDPTAESRYQRAMTNLEPKKILAELRRMRSFGTRAETAAKLKVIASQVAADSYPAELLTMQSRQRVAAAIAALDRAYDDTSHLVPDRLWAELDRCMVEWIEAEG